MVNAAYRYSFSKSLDIVEAEATLLVALMATEALHGSSAVRMEERHRFDPAGRWCHIDASSKVGQDLNRIFVGFLHREFGPDSFQVDRATGPVATPNPAAA